MRWMVFMTMVLALAAVQARAAEIVTVTVSAQQQAEECARTGRLTHCRVLNGRREGIGFSPSSPIQAERNACFYQDAMRGRYRIVEKGVARGPRGWFAVLRYE